MTWYSQQHFEAMEISDIAERDSVYSVFERSSVEQDEHAAVISHAFDPDRRA